MPSPDPKRAPDERLLSASDLAALALITVAGASVWHQTRAPMAPVTGLPWWAGTADRLLYGPDAGAWAASAWQARLDQWADMDPHRLPSWPTLVGAVLHVQPDVALAGHLVNHALMLTLPLVVYVVARATYGRGLAMGAVAFGVALNVALLAPLVQASHAASADPLVAMAQPLALALGVLAARSPLAAPLAGAGLAFCTATHLTTLGVAGPALLLALALGKPGWGRWASLAGLMLGFLVVGWGATRAVPFLEPRMFLNTLAEGITRGRDVGTHAGGLADEGAAMARLRAGLPTALDDSMRMLLANLRPEGIPWALGLALPWIGLSGVTLSLTDAPATRRATRIARALWGALAGVALVAGLAPMVAFSAAGAPERYAVNFLPVGALVFGRGAAVLVAGIALIAERGLTRWVPEHARHAQAALAVAVCTGGALWAEGLHATATTPLVALPPPPQEFDARAIGDALAAHFPPGGGVGCRVREAGGYVGRMYCPATPCPGPGTTMDVSRCLEATLDRQCGGDGPIPWVVIDSKRGDERTEGQREMDAWVEANFTPVAEVRGFALQARVYALPRP